MAVRLAIGASRWHLIWQLLTEAVVLASGGALLGVGVARVLSRTIMAFLITQRESVSLDLHPDRRVLGFLVIVMFGTCLLFGLAPAFSALQTDPGEAIKSGARGFTARRPSACAQDALVIVQGTPQETEIYVR